MRFHTRSAIAAVVLFFAASSSFAQEVEVPLDPESRVDVVDATLAQRLGLFAEYPGFQEARLFRVAAGEFVLVVRYLRDGQLVQERRPMTSEEVDTLRQTVAQRLIALPERPALDQAGRVRLLRRSSFLSLVGYGPSLVAVFDVDDPASAGALALLAGGAGFFIPYALTRNRSVSIPAAGLATTGAFLGYAHGAALAALLKGDETSGRLLAALGMTVSIGEAVAAYCFATDTRMTLGTSENVGYGGIFGAGFGLATAALVLGEDPGEDALVRTLAGLGLLGSAAGIYAGYRLSMSEPYTEGDARILATAGVLGLMVGNSALVLADADAVRPAASVMIATTAGGLILGHRLTTGRDFTASQGNFVALGTLAGSLVGSGIATLIDADEGVALALSTAGGAAGFAVMYGGYQRTTATGQGSFRLDLLPGAMRTGFGSSGPGLRPAVTLRARL